MWGALRKIRIPAVLAAGLAAGWSGKGIPAIDWILSPLVDLDYWLSLHAAYPAVFSAFVGATVTYGFYLVFVVRRGQLRKALVVLREEGVAIRNEGQQLVAWTDVEPWVAKVVDWDHRVFAALKKIDGVDAGTYRIIDHARPPREALADPLDDNHTRHYAWHDHRLIELRAYIAKYNGHVTVGD